MCATLLELVAHILYKNRSPQFDGWGFIFVKEFL
jgi:hypothetical protein